MTFQQRNKPQPGFEGPSLDSECFTAQLFDLSPYGPNLHHYAVPCDGISLHCDGQVVNLRPSRLMVVVVDSGLTGCTFSDSWMEEEIMMKSSFPGGSWVNFR